MKLIVKLLATIAVVSTATPALSAELLNTGAPTGTTFRSSDSGPGQRVDVVTATTLNQIGFYSASPSGGQVKYLIFDGTNSNLLFSTTSTYSPTASAPGLRFSELFSFALNAGSSYYFGIISDAALNVGFTSPSFTMSQNGLTATGFNTNYTNFSSPTPAGNGFASINLVLNGTQGAVPEPATWAMLILGFGAVGGAMRRRSAPAKASRTKLTYA